MNDRLWEHEFAENGGRFDRRYRAFSRTMLADFELAIRKASMALRRNGRLARLLRKAKAK